MTENQHTHHRDALPSTTPKSAEQAPETTKIPPIIMIGGISSTVPEPTQELSCCLWT
ncbi:hypothetical protein [Streptomyces chattanoogensis]|uniref:hypothetical protein n=1 Tax=Streptomyces chattanoogensis TaxID=66876 RepID=UPI0012FF1C9B|nr:hypothetical protein [Streptomyces chattanoogensis]